MPRMVQKTLETSSTNRYLGDILLHGVVAKFRVEYDCSATALPHLQEASIYLQKYIAFTFEHNRLLLHPHASNPRFNGYHGSILSNDSAISSDYFRGVPQTTAVDNNGVCLLAGVRNALLLPFLLFNILCDSYNRKPIGIRHSSLLSFDSLMCICFIFSFIATRRLI